MRNHNGEEMKKAPPPRPQPSIHSVSIIAINETKRNEWMYDVSYIFISLTLLLLLVLFVFSMYIPFTLCFYFLVPDLMLVANLRLG
jgi:hypothetical protein